MTPKWTLAFTVVASLCARDATAEEYDFYPFVDRSARLMSAADCRGVGRPTLAALRAAKCGIS